MHEVQSFPASLDKHLESLDARMNRLRTQGTYEEIQSLLVSLDKQPKPKTIPERYCELTGRLKLELSEWGKDRVTLVWERSKAPACEMIIQKQGEMVIDMKHDGVLTLQRGYTNCDARTGVEFLNCNHMKSYGAEKLDEHPYRYYGLKRIFCKDELAEDALLYALQGLEDLGMGRHHFSEEQFDVWLDPLEQAMDELSEMWRADTEFIEGFHDEDLERVRMELEAAVDALWGDSPECIRDAYHESMHEIDYYEGSHGETWGEALLMAFFYTREAARLSESFEAAKMPIEIGEHIELYQSTDGAVCLRVDGTMVRDESGTEVVVTELSKEHLAQLKRAIDVCLDL